MPNNKSYGFYSCLVSILKHVSDIISDVLTKILNKSIELGTFPSKLKMAKVIPIFKSADNTDPNNYRPISLLSCFNRLFEKLVHKRMKSFIEENNIRHNMALGKGIQRNTRYLTLSVEFNQIWMQGQGPFLKSLENVMNFELNNVFQWLTLNKLTLNQNKFCYLPPVSETSFLCLADLYS